MDLVKQIYEISARFPPQEHDGQKHDALTGQIRRAAVSVPSNIAEGAARTGSKEFLQVLSVSREKNRALSLFLIL